MYREGADVIFNAAGDSGLGIFEAADMMSPFDGVHLWAIGVDSDQYETVGGVREAAWREHILTSMVKRMDLAVYETLADFADGALTPGPLELDLASGGVEIAYSGGYLEPHRARLEGLRAMIIGGEIQVPCVPESRLEEAADLGMSPDSCEPQ
jgi:basic membrane protein A and related proteins